MKKKEEFLPIIFLCTTALFMVFFRKKIPFMNEILPSSNILSAWIVLLLVMGTVFIFAKIMAFIFKFFKK